jgi:hypothetical protein
MLDNYYIAEIKRDIYDKQSDRNIIYQLSINDLILIEENRAESPVVE